MSDKEELVQQEEQMTEESTPPQVTLADVAHSLQIIDSAVERGAFRGNEISRVGSVRDNLSRFLEYHQKQQKSQPTDK